MKKIMLTLGMLILLCSAVYAYSIYISQSDIQCVTDATELADPFTYSDEFLFFNMYQPCGITNPKNEDPETLQQCVRDYYQSDEWKLLKQKSDKALDDCKLTIRGRWL